MLLFFINSVVGLFLFLCGYFLLKINKVNAELISCWLRSKNVSMLMFWPGCIWFLLIILNLGEADFGEYKNILFGLFLVIFIYSFLHLKDWLSVRGIAIFALLFSRFLLDLNYMSDKIIGKFVAFIAYVIVVTALYLGAEPFRLRDFLNWIAKKPLYAKLMSISLFAYGTIIITGNILFFS